MPCFARNLNSGVTSAQAALLILILFLGSSVVSRQVFGKTGQIGTRFRKTETGRDGIRDNAKLNLQLKIVKKSLDNATKAPKIEISVPIF